MSELTIEQLIKIIIGVFVVVAVIAGISIIFKNQIFGFLKELPTNATGKFILGLIR